MRYQLKVLAFLGLSILFMQSCTKDEDALASTELATTTDLRGGGGQGGPGGGGPNGNGPREGEVAKLDNNILAQWMELFLEVERYAAGMRPNASARAIAYINLAAYETALPGMPTFVSNSTEIPGLNILPPNIDLHDLNFELALNACYSEVLDHFLINVPANINDKIAELEESLEAELSQGLSTYVIDESIEWGEEIAEHVIAFSQTDDAAEAQILEPQPTSYEPPTGDGFWTYSADEERALFPYWESVRTFVISPDEATTIDPVPYNEDINSEYYQQMQEVYEVNNTAKEEDNEDLWIAEFWSDDVEGLMFSPPARQISIANQLIEQYDLNLEQSLYLYLKLGFSLNDAAVATWKYKYEHMVMRPNVFIHEFIDPDYQTNLYRLVYWPNPSFPGYPSGHSCFASAAGGVFIDFFGNQTDFTDYSHEGRTEFRGAARTFSSFEEMAEENAFSRIPLGVHIRMDCSEGLRLGYEIADAIKSYRLRRNNG